MLTLLWLSLLIEENDFIRNQTKFENLQIYQRSHQRKM